MNLHFLKTTSLGSVAVLVALCSYAGAQTSSQSAQLQLVSANAQLTQSLDSRSAKPGQAVTAKLTSNVKNNGAVELEKGAILMGQVEQVQPAAGNAPAKLSLVFNQAKLKDGQTVPVKLTLLGAYPGDTGEYFDLTGNTGSLTDGQPHIIPSDQKTDQVAGALRHVSLHSDAASDTSGVFTSDSKNFELKRGTKFQVAIAAEGAAANTENGAE
jgi:hypothetical protein